MEFGHKPVLLEETINLLNVKPDGVYIDGTLGGGGHSKEIIKKLSRKGILLGIDKDSDALSHASKILKRYSEETNIILEKADFRQISEVCLKHHIDEVDGILLDLGVSSYQLDNEERGFSHNYNSKLDMRMDKSCNVSAYDIVNDYSEEELKKLIYKYGEEKWASRIAKFIVNYRKQKNIETTFELVEIIKRAIPNSARRDGSHPAKKTFQAIRIAVNDELNALEEVLKKGIKLLRKGGRFCVITFHSLEDRIVKDYFKLCENPCTCPKNMPACVCGKNPEGFIVNKKPIIPGEEEIKNNNRARSAKLRVFEKNIEK